MKLKTRLKYAKFILLLVIINPAIQAQNNTDKSITAKENSSKGLSLNVLKKYTFSAGGGKMSSNNYQVVSSIGQIDAGHITSGGGQQFIGGILAAPRNNQLFKDSFE